MKYPQWLSLPLLERELIEIANRLRTYVLRSIYAVLTLTFFGMVYQILHRIDGLGNGSLPGMGSALMAQLFATMAAAVILLLPLQSASAFTVEKERGTLIMLLLTPMGPWQLVLQKWLSRVVGMVSLLLVIMPFIAIAYSYGGVPASEVWKSLVNILLCIGEVAAMSIAISSWMRETSKAVILAFLMEIVLYIIVPLLTSWMHGGRSASYAYINLISPFEIASSSNLAVPYGLAILYPLAFILLMLGLARLVLVRRASVGGKSAILKAFRSADEVLEEWSHAGRKTRKPKRRNLPLDRPVFWHETNRRSLSSTRYLVRIFLPLFGLVVIFLPISSANAELFDITLILEILIMFLMGASCMAQEQSQQCLGVLLSTPLQASEIVNQKAAALSRIRWTMSGMLIVIALMRTAIGGAAASPVSVGDMSPSLSLCVQIVIAIILPALCMWLAMAIGIKSRNQVRAITSVLLHGIGGLVVLPMLVSAVLLGAGLGMPSAMAPITAVSPLLLLAFCQVGGPRDGAWSNPIFLGFLLMSYGFLWSILRMRCLLIADRCLRGSVS